MSTLETSAAECKPNVPSAAVTRFERMLLGIARRLTSWVLARSRARAQAAKFEQAAERRRHVQAMMRSGLPR